MCRYCNKQSCQQVTVLLCLAFSWSSLNNSDKPVEHYERPLIIFKFTSASLSYLFIYSYIAGFQLIITLIVRLYYFQFPMMDLSSVWTADPWIHSHTLPSKLSAIDALLNYLFIISPSIQALQCILYGKLVIQNTGISGMKTFGLTFTTLILR